MRSGDGTELSAAEESAVLIVEDHALTAHAFARLVRGAGFFPQLAMNTAQAVSALESLPLLRALVVDVHLGRNEPIGGLEIADLARTRSAALPILVVTGFPSPDVINRTFRLNGKLVTKPLGAHDLSKALEFLKGGYSVGSHRRPDFPRFGEELALGPQGLLTPVGTVLLSDRTIALLRFLLSRAGQFTTGADVAREFIGRTDRAAPTLVRQHVAHARRSLGAFSWLIESVPKRGYRIAPRSLGETER